jgi:hypothetical protein
MHPLGFGASIRDIARPTPADAPSGTTCAWTPDTTAKSADARAGPREHKYLNHMAITSLY